LKIIEGFQQAKLVLSRQGPAQKALEVDEREQVVRQIIEEVRRRGDAALFDYTEKFDGVKLSLLEIDKKQITSAYREVDAGLLSALKLAAERIRAFHQMQRERTLRTYTHGKTGWLVRPLERVGIYVPGGTAIYPSTVLMTVIPAKVAGVKEVILVTPPGKQGGIAPVTLVAADIAGVGRIFSVGGAQAIAALAFGTESIPSVDKVCGPGNIYVLLAKKLLYGVVGIDGLYGPSEVMIIADETANPEYCAADLLAQAEHDSLASAILITTSRRLADRVNQEVERQLESLPRKSIAVESLKNRGMIVVVSSVDEAIELANIYAPEHVCLLVDKSDAYVERLSNAGCIIFGQKATVAMSDYISGPSHVLPTGGTARFSSPLNVMDFMKLANVSKVGEGLMSLAGKVAITIALAEGLDAHAHAVELRLKKVTRKTRKAK
jgi:histidinol dehydrogenase